VDHLLVMEGNGQIKDFPGTYSEYAEWRAAKEAEAAKERTAEKPRQERQRTERKAKMSFKERKEFESLTAEIDELNAEKANLEAKFNSGEQLDDVATLSARYEEIKDLLDEKELRWLELSELA
jgi:ATP-binding cassette subfamily F protein uup